MKPDAYFRKLIRWNDPDAGSSGGSLGMIRATEFATNTVDIGAGNTWSPIAGSLFGSIGLDSRFALTAESCILTYTGPTLENVLFTLFVSFEMVGGAVSGTCGAALDYDGDLLGQTMQHNQSAAAGANEADIPTGGAISIPSARMIAALASGETIRPTLAKFDNIADMSISGLCLMISR